MTEESLQSFLDSGTAFEGKVSFTGTVRIDGAFKGEAVSEGTLVIGPSAEVDAQIQVGSLVVQGSIRGDFTASDLIELAPSARVEGELHTRRLVVAEGAQLNAKIEMKQRDAPAPAPPRSPTT